MADPKRVIIFDLDGVIVNSISLMAELARGAFPDIDHQGFKDLHKNNIHEVASDFKFHRKVETAEEANRRFEQYAEKKLKVPLYDGMKGLLLKLAKDNTLVINTSATSANCVPILESNDVAKCFEFIAALEIHRSKVEKFKIIAEKFGRQLPELIFVTDTVGDVKEANKAGVPTVVVTWGLHSRQDFEGVPAEYIKAFVNTPEELEKYLET